ncbi:uncharacterized protein L203_100626 [Cryptococcus depauperatus CBS 7841]|uniref:Uncharacterized protein n=1 Tax=Cryptococcus depauperatus CBS 7841 TaxID=1295531 RepID=A0A1E3IX62_9TREE|nr:ESCRT-I complex subunit TSG101 [Cryptococcus depauperatus CBS 7841]
MSNADLTRGWLQSVLRPFPSRDVILQQVLEVLRERRTLAVKTEAFTFDSGHTALLLLLYGTLPITYRGATYQIPMHLWIPHEYPRLPPLVFVMPTKEMGIRKSREVEPSGHIREQVMNEWWRTWDIKDLGTLLKHLSDLFSVTPPVFAKPPGSDVSERGKSPLVNSQSPALVCNQATNNQPPVPPTRLAVESSPNVEMLPTYRPAPSPPLPLHSHVPTHVRQSSTPSYTSHTSATVTNMANLPPPIPTHPTRGVPPQTPAVVPVVPPRPYSVTYPMPSQLAGSSSQGNMPTESGNMSSQDLASGIQPIAGTYHSITRVQPPASQVTVSPPQSVLYPQTSPTLQPPAVQAPKKAAQDLLSSPEPSFAALPSDSSSSSHPPPLPPSKPPPPSLLHLHSILLPHLQTSLSLFLQSFQSSIEHLQARRDDLKTGEPAIRDEMARLEAVKKVCDSVGKRMEDVVHQGEARVVELEAKGEVGVDELVCGISIVHNQMIDLVAEDNAIEDTIYHMTRALDAERVDLDRYLKSIRSLAREQYMKRALIERILQGMGQTQGW